MGGRPAAELRAEVPSEAAPAGLLPLSPHLTAASSQGRASTPLPHPQSEGWQQPVTERTQMFPKYPHIPIQEMR